MIIHKDRGDGSPKCGTWSRLPWVEGDYSKSKGFEVNCKKCLGTTKQTTKSVSITENMVGKIFRTSWGYDMTINEYAKVIKQSDKSILLQECYAIVKDDYGKGAGRAKAGGLKEDGKKFRLSLKERDTGYGKPYTYWAGHLHGSGVDYWSEWDGQESYHNTWD